MSLFNNTLLLSLLLLLTISSIVSSENECVYSIYVRTGTIWKGGTDSIISVNLYAADGHYVQIPNLEAWGGLMEPGHNYFERGNLDIFSGRAPCINVPLCALNLTSDGSGPHHGWFCNYLEVTSTGPHQICQQQRFDVDQWLASDAPPYELTAIRNYCATDDVDDANNNNNNNRIIKTVVDG
ncbi:hypothetical protein ACFE04_019312 [Oxalis oulophora]